MDEYAKLITSAAAQNNAWSAEQAQKQMEFQERMSSTAHQREVADLKAAGINPVLSAKLGGASTPTGAMGSTDTGLTSALVDLLQMSMEAANSAAGAAYASANQSDKGLFGLPLIKNPRQPWQIAYNWVVSDEKVQKFYPQAAQKAEDAIVKGLNALMSGSAKSQIQNSGSIAPPAYGSNGRHTRGGSKSQAEVNNAKGIFTSVIQGLKKFR